MSLWRALPLLALATACSSSDDGGKSVTPEPDLTVIRPNEDGPYVVGTTRFELAAHDSRTLPVQIWYPADASAKDEAKDGHPLAELEPAGSRRDALAQLVKDAPEGCTSRTYHAAQDAEAHERPAPWPLLVFSHCHQCTRFSELAVAERLASWGYVVAAPDHEGNTLYDMLDGSPSQLTSDFLQTRGKDIRDVLDAVIDGAEGVPEGLTIDEDRIGMFGHSFGSVTAGLVLQDDARVRAGVFMAAPPENPLLTGVTLSKLTQPALFILAEEDNSIGALGNQVIQQNFEAYPSRAWLASVKDAGHWSFSDIAGIAPDLAPGCGVGKRQENPDETFTYLDNDLGRGIAQAYVTALFATVFSDGKTVGAADYLQSEAPAGVVTVTSPAP